MLKPYQSQTKAPVTTKETNLMHQPCISSRIYFFPGFSRTKCDIIIGSDLNFDFNKVNNNRNTSDLLDIFFTAGVLPTVKRPTRITHTSATVIYNMFL